MVVYTRARGYVFKRVEDVLLTIRNTKRTNVGISETRCKQNSTVRERDIKIKYRGTS